MSESSQSQLEARIAALEAELEEARAERDKAQANMLEWFDEAGRLKDKLAEIRAVVKEQMADDDLWHIGAYYKESMRKALLDLHEVIDRD